MASATFVHDIHVADRATVTSAAWWRRGHTYGFVAVAVAEVGLTWGVVRLVEYVVNGPRGFGDVATAAMIGFMFAQCFLLGLWAALGGLPTVVRWLLVGVVSTAGALAVTDQIVASDWGQFIDQGPIIALVAGLTMAGFAVVLLPLRRLANWRVDFDAAYHPSTGRRRGQIELMDFAALFCAVALPLTLCRSLIELMGNEAADIGVIIPIFGALVLVTAAPAAYAVLARRGVWLWIACYSVWLVAVCIVQSLMVARFPDLDVFDGRSSIWGLNSSVFAFHMGVAATVALPLGVLRLLGLRIIAVQ